ncbi:MAG: Gfo/Idh/MocA family oxidoreductase, partial [Microbacterium sp.]|uniref:Gfo/Idh/MocA family protein n=1 Tax=Microbacterium sp. TaxID=51671 RepID=UPI003BAEE187
MNHPYTFDALPEPVVTPDEFRFAAVGLDHAHIHGMTDGLLGAGAGVTWVFDQDAAKAAAFAERYPSARIASSEQEILDDPAVHLVATAAIASERAPVALRAIEAGKDAFVDKAPLTTLTQLEAAREATARTGRKYAVYYGERLHTESAVLADQLIQRGAIGRVLQVASFGPHRVGTGRPAWFFDPAQYGG